MEKLSEMHMTFIFVLLDISINSFRGGIIQMDWNSIAAFEQIFGKSVIPQPYCR